MSIAKPENLVAFLEDLVLRPLDQPFPEYVVKLLSTHFGYHNLGFFQPVETERHKENLCQTEPKSIRFPLERLTAYVDSSMDTDIRTVMDNYNEYYFALDYMIHSKLSGGMQDKLVLQSNELTYASEEYIQYLHSRSLYHFLCLYLRDSNNDYIGRLAFSKYKEEGGFPKEEVNSLINIAKFVSRQQEIYLQSTEQNRNYKLFDIAFQSSTTGLIYLDKFHNIVFHNPQAEEFCADICKKEGEPEQMECLKASSGSFMQKVINCFLLKQKGLSGPTQFYQCGNERYDLNLLPCVIGKSGTDPQVFYIVQINLKKILKTESEIIIRMRFAQDYNLTERELELLQLLQIGLSTMEIAKSMYISPHTVKTHISNIFRKTNVKNRTMLINKYNNYFQQL